MFGFEWNEEEYRTAMQKLADERESRGRLEATISNIKSLMKNLNLSASDAMKALGIAPTEYNHYMTLL